MKLFIDTNIILDLLQYREPWSITFLPAMKTDSRCLIFQ
jgi:hypothetical protein